MKKLFILCITFFSASVRAQSGIEIPHTDSVQLIIRHTGYSLRYNEAHEQACWVAYELTAEETRKTVERSDKFVPDPAIPTGSATSKDYEGSGYDRGHLAPAADMGWSEQAMQESFYYSNMSPQVPGFNRGIWKKLEEQVRTWATENENLYIVTGPVLKKGLKAIGPNKVSVPEHYYKVILDYTRPDVKAIGFIFPNAASADSLQRFAVTIDSVEAFTGMDFFPALNDKDEERIERTLCVRCWSWGKTATVENGILDGAAFPEEKSRKATEKKAEAVQCSGKTQAGKRCRNMTTNANGRCHLH